MLRLVVAVPISVIAACLGAVVGVLAVASPRSLLFLTRALPEFLFKRGRGREGFFISMPLPSSPAVVLLRCIARAAGAFGAARLVLVVFGLGPLASIAVLVAALLSAWDLRRLTFLSSMSFSPPVATVQLYRIQVIIGLIVSVTAVFLFLNT